jgi:UDP-N-acetyl-D-glucosamine dehydrogenase
LAAEINGMMPAVVTSMVGEGLNRFSKSIRGSKLLILGVAYKKNVSDCRESPALDIMRMLSEKGAILSYNDPFVPTLRTNGNTLKSVELTPATIKSQGCTVFLRITRAMTSEGLSRHPSWSLTPEMPQSK